MEVVTNALAALTAAKARIHDLVEPEKEIAARTEAVIHALVTEIEAACARIASLEQQVAALSTPAQEPPAQPDAGAGAPVAHSADNADDAPAPAASTGS